MTLPVKTTQISLFDFDDELNISTYFIDDDNEYEMLCNFVKTYVGADCRALTINDEIIFNSYNELTNFKDQIHEDIIRDQIIRNPHRCLFCSIHRGIKNGVIRIYMMEEPYLQIIEIHFDSERMTYYLMVYNGKF
jgi:hypothetical protein